MEEQQLLKGQAWTATKKPLDAYGELAIEVIYASLHTLKKSLKRNDTEKAVKELEFLRTESPWHRYLDIDMDWIEKTIDRVTKTYATSEQHMSLN